MMKNLFLTSYLAGVKHQLANFLQKHQISQVLFIATAGNVEEYTDYIDEGRELFQSLGVVVEDCDIAKLGAVAIRSRLDQAQAVYFSGGNSFYLLQELQKKVLLKSLKGRVENGLPYLAESAGAIIASPNIAYSQLMDEREKAPHLANDFGLKLVDFYIVPHVGEFPFEESAQAILDQYQENLAILPLNNAQAVVVEGNRYQIVEE